MQSLWVLLFQENTCIVYYVIAIGQISAYIIVLLSNVKRIIPLKVYPDIIMVLV